jgi:hypothetical protein
MTQDYEAIYDKQLQRLKRIDRLQAEIRALVEIERLREESKKANKKR